MAKKDLNAKAPAAERGTVSAQPRLHQRAPEIQRFGTVSHMLPLDLEEPVRLEMTEQLNLLLADTITLRDLYKKSHWQVSGPTFYQLHLLFDKHFGEQSEIVDTIAERIQLLGGISIAMAADVAETTRIERPPKGREEVPVQISRLLDAHQIIIGHCRELARRADNWAMTAPTTWRSAMCSAPMNCKYGFSASTWWRSHSYTPKIRGCAAQARGCFADCSLLLLLQRVRLPASACRGRSIRKPTSASRHPFSRCASPRSAGCFAEPAPYYYYCIITT
jgi:starvation-inducible DNA-binding protein